MLSPSVLVNESANRGMLPPPALSVSEWAQRHRVVTSPSPEPGPWRNARTPYLKQPMDCLSPFSRARTIAIMKGSQVGATEAALNWVGFTIHHAPTSMMIVLPDMGTAKEWSTLRLARLTESTECLRDRILPAARRDSGNSMLSKKFPGGFLKLTWASSAARLRSTPASNLVLDEVDAFEGDTDGEGDPVGILKRRFTNFPRGKMLLISTPTGQKNSRIEREFKAGDQRYYFVPCPFCGHFQRLTPSSFHWEAGRTDTAYVRCILCEKSIPEQHKTQLLARGAWVATAGNESLYKEGFSSLSDIRSILDQMERETAVSFHLSARYSPTGWYSWKTLASDHEKAQGDVRLNKVFINTVDGKTWVERGDAPQWQNLYSRRRMVEPGSAIPEGGLFLTAGVDVQKEPSRLECELVAWGRNWRSWSIDYRVFKGDINTDAPWLELEAYLAQTFPHESGAALSVIATSIDSGHNPAMVYKFAKRHPQAIYEATASIRYPHTVLITKGGRSHDKLIESVTGEDAAKKHMGLRIYWLGTHYLKQEFVIDWLKSEQYEADGEIRYPNGWCEFPNYEPWIFQGYCAESRVVRAGGRVDWVKEPAFRNEPLDCRLGARAAAEIYAGRFKEQHWLNLEQAVVDLASRAKLSADGAAVVVENPKPQPSGQDEKKSWIGGASRSGGSWINGGRR